MACTKSLGRAVKVLETWCDKTEDKPERPEQDRGLPSTERKPFGGSPQSRPQCQVVTTPQRILRMCVGAESLFHSGRKSTCRPCTMVQDSPSDILRVAVSRVFAVFDSGYKPYACVLKIQLLVVANKQT